MSLAATFWFLGACLGIWAVVSYWIAKAVDDAIEFARRAEEDQ